MQTRLFWRCWCAAVVFAGSAALAQDRVLLQQPGGSRIPMSGYVEDYNGRELLLRIRPSEPLRRFPREEIVEVTTEYTPHHEQGKKLFAEGQIADARTELAEALSDEDRSWVRREILALQVKCYLWDGDYQMAAVRFLPIVASDAETFHYGLIPLNWTNDEPPAKLRAEAHQWIAAESKPVMRLLGASWLLSLRESTADMEQILRKLARDADVRVQRAAQMQLWRVKLLKGVPLEANEIEHWQRFVDGLPLELRGGAYSLIGQAWSQRREFERAARAYLWLPLVFDSDRWLSARACYEAANALEQAGDTQQASTLYAEVVFRYENTPWGPKAESAWKSLKGVAQAKDAAESVPKPQIQ